MWEYIPYLGNLSIGSPIDCAIFVHPVYQTSIGLQESGRKFILGFSVKILTLACFVRFVGNGEGQLQEKKMVDDNVPAAQWCIRVLPTCPLSWQRIK